MRWLHNNTNRVERMNALSDSQAETYFARLVGKRRLSHDVVALYLKLPRRQCQAFRAGHYVDIVLEDGQRRSYSVANSPHSTDIIELHVKAVTGGWFTTRMIESLEPMSLLCLKGPLGNLYLREQSTRAILFIGGGTGFAPLKGLIEYAFHQGVKRDLWLYWGARAFSNLYQHELPLYWANRHGNFYYTPVLSEPGPGDSWTGRVGLVHEIAAEDHPDLAGFDAYVSGPAAMVAAVRERFLTSGMSPERFYSDG